MGVKKITIVTGWMGKLYLVQWDEYMALFAFSLF